MQYNSMALAQQLNRSIVLVGITRKSTNRYEYNRELAIHRREY